VFNMALVVEIRVNIDGGHEVLGIGARLSKDVSFWTGFVGASVYSVSA